MFPADLQDEYVRKHARPGEDWDEARRRLGGEVARRYRKLPICEICAMGAESMKIAAERHSLGMCAAYLSEWPAAAMSKSLFDAAREQSATHTRAQAAIARGNIEWRLQHIQCQTHPINAIRLACQVGGYIDACEELGLFEPVEIIEWRKQVQMEHQKAEADFVRQFHQRDPDALPWRSAKLAEKK